MIENDPKDRTWLEDRPADPELTDPELIYVEAENAERRRRIVYRALIESGLPAFARYIAEQVLIYKRTQLLIEFVMDMLGDTDPRRAKRFIAQHLARTARVLKPIVRQLKDTMP